MSLDTANPRNALSINSVVRETAAGDVLANNPALVAEHRGKIPDQHPLQANPVRIEAAREDIVSEEIPVGNRWMGLQEPLHQIAGLSNVEPLGTSGEQEIDNILRAQFELHLRPWLPILLVDSLRVLACELVLNTLDCW
jgi:hypothetical protein